MNVWRSDVVSALPQLRQVAFIMAGDEHAADVAVAHVLRLAHQRTDDVSDFPCTLSWLLAKLARLPVSKGENLNPDHSPPYYVPSLLDLPSAERLCLVLVDGLKFEASLVSRIIAEPQETVDARLQRARQMFTLLLDQSQHLTSELDVEASAAMNLGQSPKHVSPIPAPGDVRW